ncbi:ribonucleotide-diphosphate reductase subunit beta [Halorientalis litorea]|uniref:ribonucleotide-diphosphate reductase subunit beta n=1 Tax=Halorientalis litorea TaxID=2931977 RepID=UPI001FF32E7B|nr:ribonucleotide-diphosphate reductase subunit beta [Halorientalis litorea]
MCASANPVPTGRIDSDSIYYELYQKSIELGTWDANKLVEKVGFEEDKEVWDSLEEDEKEQWARLISYFIDGEQAVAADARRIMKSVSSPHFDRSLEKEMFASALAVEEAKHTQFFDLYITNVMEDKFPQYKIDNRRGGIQIPRTEACGAGEMFERQGTLQAQAAHGGNPADIARAATNYHIGVEGILARGGYYLKNNMMQESPLPLLNKGFQFISTDEGRHITFGLEVLQELIEKEREGVPEYQGVQKAIWDQAVEDIGYIVDTAYFVTNDVGDPLNADFDGVINRGSNLAGDMLFNTLELEGASARDFAMAASDAVNEAEGSTYDDVIDEYEHIYSQRMAGD